jgi:hypothetical protein
VTRRRCMPTDTVDDFVRMAEAEAGKASVNQRDATSGELDTGTN